MSATNGSGGKSYLAASLDFMVKPNRKDLDIIMAHGKATGDTRVADYALKEDARLRAAAKATFAKHGKDPEAFGQAAEQLAATVTRSGPKTGFDLS